MKNEPNIEDQKLTLVIEINRLDMVSKDLTFAIASIADTPCAIQLQKSKELIESVRNLLIKEWNEK